MEELLDSGLSVLFLKKKKTEPAQFILFMIHLFEMQYSCHVLRLIFAYQLHCHVHLSEACGVLGVSEHCGELFKALPSLFDQTTHLGLGDVWLALSIQRSRGDL